MTKHTGLALYMNRWEGDPNTQYRFANHYRARAYALLVQVKHQPRYQDNRVSANGMEFVLNHYGFMRREALADLAKAKKAGRPWHFMVGGKRTRQVHQAQLNLMGLRAFRRANLDLIQRIEQLNVQAQ